jgi:hypothetical protein
MVQGRPRRVHPSQRAPGLHRRPHWLRTSRAAHRDLRERQVHARRDRACPRHNWDTRAWPRSISARSFRPLCARPGGRYPRLLTIRREGARSAAFPSPSVMCFVASVRSSPPFTARPRTEHKHRFKFWLWVRLYRFLSPRYAHQGKCSSAMCLHRRRSHDAWQSAGPTDLLPDVLIHDRRV